MSFESNLTYLIRLDSFPYLQNHNLFTLGSMFYECIYLTIFRVVVSEAAVFQLVAYNLLTKILLKTSSSWKPHDFRNFWTKFSQLNKLLYNCELGYCLRLDINSQFIQVYYLNPQIHDTNVLYPIPHSSSSR